MYSIKLSQYHIAAHSDTSLGFVHDTALAFGHSSRLKYASQFALLSLRKYSVKWHVAFRYAFPSFPNDPSAPHVNLTDSQYVASHHALHDTVGDLYHVTLSWKWTVCPLNVQSL